MKRSILSEKSLVVVMFIAVVVIFSFAHADTKDIENGYLDSTPPVTITVDQPGNAEANVGTTEIKQTIPSVHLR